MGTFGPLNLWPKIKAVAFEIRGLLDPKAIAFGIRGLLDPKAITFGIRGLLVPSIFGQKSRL